MDTPQPAITRVSWDDPDAQSADPVAQNLAALQGLFPDAFTEGRVDFDALRQLLGDAVDDGEEKYGLNWSGKRQARRLALTPSAGTLLPARADSVEWDTTQNLIIEGDNLEVLKLLQKSYAGKVKLIYIDPPYNTGSDFVYPDDYSDSLTNYLMRTKQLDAADVRNSSNPETSGRFHTDWLNMIYPRLMLAREMLHRHGVIAVSVDDHESDNLRLVLDSIFGRENFIITITWEKGRKNDSTFFSETVEYMHIYARSRLELAKLGEWRELKPGLDDIMEYYQKSCATYGTDHSAIEEDMREFYESLHPGSPSKKLRHFYRSDARGLYFGGDISSASTSIPDYEIKHPGTGRPCKKPSRGWGCNPDEMERRIAEGRVHFGDDETTIPLKKNYLEEVDSMVRTPVIYKDGRGASMELKSLLGATLFDNPKDRETIAGLMNYMAPKDAIILDFFAGSGTSGHAVMALNAFDGGSRRFILVQLPEPLSVADKEQKNAAKFCDHLGVPATLAELTKERLRRAGKSVRTEGVEKAFDSGFRVYKLATSNLKAWNPGADLAQDLLSAADNLMPGRTDDDLLVELLLKQGIDLSEPALTCTIAGCSVHAFGGGVLVVCLASVLAAEAEALADGIADWIIALNPAAAATIFFKDAGFESDVAKTNIAKILEQRLNGRARDPQAGTKPAELLLKVRSV